MSLHHFISADISARGGNKKRLIARIYFSLLNFDKVDDNNEAYLLFQEEHSKKTFKQLHDQYDWALPAKFKSK